MNARAVSGIFGQEPRLRQGERRRKGRRFKNASLGSGHVSLAGQYAVEHEGDTSLSCTDLVGRKDRPEWMERLRPYGPTCGRAEGVGELCRKMEWSRCRSVPFPCGVASGEYGACIQKESSDEESSVPVSVMAAFPLLNALPGDVPQPSRFFWQVWSQAAPAGAILSRTSSPVGRVVRALLVMSRHSRDGLRGQVLPCMRVAQEFLSDSPGDQPRKGPVGEAGGIPREADSLFQGRCCLIA